MKSKRGLSMVVTAVLLIALTIVLITIIGNTTKDLTEDRLSKAESCFGIFEKVTLNDRYTCYNASSNLTQFSLERKEFEMDELLVSVSFGEDSKSFVITENLTQIYGVYPYQGSAGTSVSLPSNEGGKTYILNETSSKPIKIQIAPKVNGNQCETSDSMSEFVLCS